MKIITKAVYTFRELLELEESGQVSTIAVEKARNWLSDIEDDWSDSVIEMWHELLKSIGFSDIKIQFSGFWSQGDGASFTCKIDFQKFAEFLATERQESNENYGTPEYLLNRIGWNGINQNTRFEWLSCFEDYFQASIRRGSYRYSHENTCSFELDYSGRANIDRVYQDFVDLAEELRTDICRAIYSDLQQEYEYRTSDECLSEQSWVNDYYFDENGDFDS